MTLKRTPWAQFDEFWRAVHKPGQHVTIIAPTGVGKTYLARHLLRADDHVIAVGSKVRDTSLDKFTKVNGYKRIKTFDAIEEHLRLYRGASQNRLLLWPDLVKACRDVPEDEIIAKIKSIITPEINKLLGYVALKGLWTLYIDETQYMSTRRAGFGLEDSIGHLHTQARSNFSSIYTAFQRPAWVPHAIYSSASWAFLGKTSDNYDLKALKGFNGQDPRRIQHELNGLQSRNYEMLAIDCRGTSDQIYKIICNK